MCSYFFVCKSVLSARKIYLAEYTLLINFTVDFLIPTKPFKKADKSAFGVRTTKSSNSIQNTSVKSKQRYYEEKDRLTN